jgi:hypothetical protein
MANHPEGAPPAVSLHIRAIGDGDIYTRSAWVAGAPLTDFQEYGCLRHHSSIAGEAQPAGLQNGVPMPPTHPQGGYLGSARRSAGIEKSTAASLLVRELFSGKTFDATAAAVPEIGYAARSKLRTVRPSTSPEIGVDVEGAGGVQAPPQKRIICLRASSK